MKNLLGLSVRLFIGLLTSFLLSSCNGIKTSFTSARQIGAGVNLSVQSTNVTYDGTQLLGTVSVKATDATGAAVSDYTPEISVDSTSSISSGVFSGLQKNLKSAATKLGVTTQATVSYSVLPCSASDASGVSVCQVAVTSGTGQLNLEIVGSSTTVPLTVSLNFYAAPTLTAVSPAQVQAGNHVSTLTLTGTNFRSPMTVTVGSTSCASVVISSSTSASCQLTTDSSIGLRNIQISNPDLQLSTMVSSIEYKDLQAPVIAFLNTPASLTNIASTTITYTVTDDISAVADLTIQCTLDGVTQSCSANTASLGSLTEGSHVFSVNARDVSGNSSSASYSWALDTTPPTIAINSSPLSVSPSNSIAARVLTLSGADVVSYKAVVSSTGSCSGASFTSATETVIGTSYSLAISTDGSYTVCAIGKDVAGNWQVTPTASTSLVIDTLAPSITIATNGLGSSPSNSTATRSMVFGGTDVAYYKATYVKDVLCSSVDFSTLTEQPIAQSFGFTPSLEGTYYVCARGRDLAGNWQTTTLASSSLVISLTAPIIAIDSSTLSPSPSNVTTARSITMSGSRVATYKAVALKATSCASANFTSVSAVAVGTPFSFTSSGDAYYIICAVGIDSAGNQQAVATASSILQIDTSAPVIAIDDSGMGVSPSKDLSSRALVMSGAGVVSYKAGVSNTGSCSGFDFSSAAVTAVGTSYSLIPTIDASYIVCAIGVDTAGNWQSTATASRALVIDHSDPIASIDNTNIPTPSNSLSARSVTISGSAVVSYKAVLLNATTCTSADFTSATETVVATPFSFLPTGQGNWILCVIGKNSLGTWQSPSVSASRVVVIDTTAPTIDAIALGTSPSNISTARSLYFTGTDVVNYKAITYTSSGSCNSTILNAASSTPIGTAYSLSFSGDGIYYVCAIGQDLAGNWQSTATVSSALTLDTVVTPFTSLAVAPAVKASNPKPTFSGNTEALAAIAIYQNSSCSGTSLATGTASAGGAFSVQLSSNIAADGAYQFYVKATDAASNTLCSTAIAYTLDTTVIPFSNLAISPVSPGNVTRPTITGTTEIAASLTLYSGSSTCANTSIGSATADGSGNFSFQPTSSLGSDGSYQLYVKAVDSLGNTLCSSALNYALDTVITPFSGLALTPASPGQSPTITVAGSSEANASVVLYNQASCGGSAIKSGTASATGSFSVTSPSLVVEAAYNFSVQATDAAGNSVCSSALAYTFDKTAPVLTITSPVANASSQTGATVAGACETGLTVNFSGSGLSAASTATCTSGAYSSAITFSSGDGNKSFVASQTDAAGNIGSISLTLVKDTTPPAIAVTGPAVNFNAQAGVTLTGTCEAGLAVALSGAGLGSPTTTTCANGTFSQAVVFTGADGTKNIIVSQTDAAGNVGTDNRNFVQDTVAPALAITTPAAGTSAKTGVTITGTCETGLAIALSGAGLASPSTTTCTSGAFSQAITFTAVDGAKAITLTQTDAAGNSAPVSISFVKDTTPPVLTFASTAIQTQTTNLNSASFSGTCEDGLTITVKLAGAVDGSLQCTGGSWAYSTATQISDAARTYTFIEDDLAGNETTATGTWTRDATAPTLTISSPTANLLLAGGATLSIQWASSDANLGTFPIKIEYTANGGTSWSVLAPTLMNTGSYTWTLPTINSTTVQVRVTSTDSLGNASAVVSGTFSIDSAAPLVSLTSLTGGQLLKGGGTQAITWSASDTNMAATPITLAYSSDNGSTWNTIASALANSGSYSWTVPTVDSTTYLVRVTAVDQVSHSAQAVSPAPFAVDATVPTLTGVTVNGQAGGITVGTSATVTIGWNAADANFDSYPIALYYSTNGGSTWSLVSTTSLANSPNSYSWSLTGLGFSDGSTYRVKVQATDKVGNVTSVQTTNFSVVASAPNLTFASGTSTNLYSNANTVTYTGTCSNGYSITVSGTDSTSSTATCTSAAWSWTTATKSSDASITYTFSQNNGALTTSIAATWVRDTAAPTISNVALNGGATSTSLRNLSVQVSASDTNMTGLQVQLAIANTSTQACPSVGTSWQAFSSSGTGTYAFSIAPPTGTKTVCAWVKDAAGNVSAVNTAAISYSSGTIPRITSLAVSNGVSGSSNYGTSTYASGDTVAISWVIADSEGLDQNPVYLDYSTDGTTWNTIVSGYGSLSPSALSYSGTYTGFSAPAGFFEIRIRAVDNSGNYAVPLVSTPQNSGRWGVFAGSTDRGVGSGATSAILGTSLQVPGSIVAVNPSNGDIYAIDRSAGVVKIPSATGIVSSYLGNATTATLSVSGGTITSSLKINPVTTGLAFNGGYLYILSSDNGILTASSKIYRVDPKTDAYTLYWGGGTDTSTSATSTTAFVMPDNFTFDESNSLYYFTSCASPVTSYSTSTSTVRLMKVTQQTDGTAGTVTAVAGNCVNGTPVSGTAATSTPIGDGANIGYTSMAVWNNGAAIYFRLHQSGTVYKVISGTLYSTAVAAAVSYTGLTYNAADGLLYVSPSSTIKYTPSLSGANGETNSGTYLASNGSSIGCSGDNILASTACVTANKTLVGPGGQVWVLDGSTLSNRAYRIRYVDSNLKVWTLAGTQSFYGDGLNATYSHGSYAGIYYKQATTANNSSLTALPVGLYFTDNLAGVFGTINSSGTVSVLWGNQSGNAAPTTYSGTPVMSSGTTAGSAYGRPNLANFALGFDASGYPWLRDTYTQIVTLNSSFNPTHLSSSTVTSAASPNWMYADPSAITPTTASYYFALNSNTTMKDTTQASPAPATKRKGFFSLGAYYVAGSWTSPGPVLRYFDFNNNQIIHLMGNSATAAVTADSSGATNLTTATFSSSCQVQSSGACYTQFVENDPSTEADDVLYFVEGTTLRSITNPLNPGSQVLTTVLTESNAIANFILSPDNKHVYYEMSGYLYCYSFLRQDQTEDCRWRKADSNSLTANLHQHGPIGPPTGMTTLPTTNASDSMTWKDSKTLLISNGAGQIYSYTTPQPTTTTKNLAWGVNLKKTLVYTGGATNGVYSIDKMRAAFQVLQARNIKQARIDTQANQGNVQLANTWIQLGQQYGITNFTYLLTLEWLGAPSDSRTFTTDDTTALYNSAYNATYSFVMNFVNTQNGTSQITDWELGNELDIKINQTSSPGGYNYGYQATDWANISALGSAHYFENFAALLKGGSDAITTINNQYGTHMRTMVNFVGTHIGFIKFMQSKGVHVDVATYHYYQPLISSPYAWTAASEPGTGVNFWNLFAGMAELNMPISVNEINCNDIYNTSYTNTTSDPLFTDCLQTLKTHIGLLKNNSEINLESIYLHMLLDDPHLTGQEQDFGLMWVSSTDNVNYTYTPKPGLYLFSLFAGGTLTQAEQDVLTTYITLPLP